MLQAELLKTVASFVRPAWQYDDSWANLSKDEQERKRNEAVTVLEKLNLRVFDMLERDLKYAHDLVGASVVKEGHLVSTCTLSA